MPYFDPNGFCYKFHSIATYYLIKMITKITYSLLYFVYNAFCYNILNFYWKSKIRKTHCFIQRFFFIIGETSFCLQQHKFVF